MRIRNVRHKGLKNFINRDDPSKLPHQHISKIRNIVAFLQDMEEENEV